MVVKRCEEYKKMYRFRDKMSYEEFCDVNDLEQNAESKNIHLFMQECKNNTLIQAERIKNIL